MEEKEIETVDNLQEIFQLPNEWIKALYSIEYCITKHSILRDKNAEKRQMKLKWLDEWKNLVLRPLNKGSNICKTTLITDDIELQQYLSNLCSKTSHLSHSYLIILEAFFFRPFFQLNKENQNTNSNKFNKLSYRVNTEYINIFSRALGIDDEILNLYKKRFKKAYMNISGKSTTIAISAIVSGIVIALTAGAAAPEIAVLFAAQGLTGAAAISSGLAAIGGGALVAGGTGMAGGITVLVSTGGILGIAGGTAVGTLVANSPNATLLMASKLDVFVKEVVIPKLKDPETQKQILKALISFISSVDQKLNQLTLDPKRNSKKIRALKLSLKYLNNCLKSVRKSISKEIAQS